MGNPRDTTATAPQAACNEAKMKRNRQDPARMMNERREVLTNSLTGIALVFRFGNPSAEPVSTREKRTYDEAQKQEEEKRTLDDPNEAKEFFERCGVSLLENVCSGALEKRLVNRTVDLVIEKRSIRTRGRGEQPFYEPTGVANRELYLVSTASCETMIQQKGAPFADDSCGARVAWAVDGQDINKKGTDIKIERSSLVHTTGGALMPDVSLSNKHSQNLDNPANAPFLELLTILRGRFTRFLSNRNHMMCLQLILAEPGKDEGRRGFHQDMWATTGAMVIGVTILNGRALTMRHNGILPQTCATYSLPRRSAYVLSGAARYGTLWNGLQTEFYHCLHAFTAERAPSEAGACVDMSICAKDETDSVETGSESEPVQVSSDGEDADEHQLHRERDALAEVKHLIVNEDAEKQELRRERDAALAEVEHLKKLVIALSDALVAQQDADPQDDAAKYIDGKSAAKADELGATSVIAPVGGVGVASTCTTNDRVHHKDLQIYHLTFDTQKIGLQFQKVPVPSTRSLSNDANNAAADTCLQLSTPIDSVLVCGLDGFNDSGKHKIRPKLGALLVAFDGVSLEIGNWTYHSIQKAIQARGRPITLSFRNDFATTDQRMVMAQASSQAIAATSRKEPNVVHDHHHPNPRGQGGRGDSSGPGMEALTKKPRKERSDKGKPRTANNLRGEAQNQRMLCISRDASQMCKRSIDNSPGAGMGTLTKKRRKGRFDKGKRRTADYLTDETVRQREKRKIKLKVIVKKLLALAKEGNEGAAPTEKDDELGQSGEAAPQVGDAVTTREKSLEKSMGRPSLVHETRTKCGRQPQPKKRFGIENYAFY